MRIELAYPDGSVETFFANVPDGQNRIRRATRVTLITPKGERRVMKDRGTPPAALLPAYERRRAP